MLKRIKHVTRKKHKYIEVKQIVPISKKVIKLFNSIKEAEESINAIGTNISKCCNGKLRTYYGYIWEYQIV